MLGPEESVHCVRVLRRKVGDVIFVTDGRGSRFECRIVDAATRGVRLDIISSSLVARSWNFNITLAVAPTKNADRMSWLVEKATEIGVDRIMFIECRHSERRNLNIGRLRRVAISAMNQSLKTWLPDIPEVQPLDNLFVAGGLKYFGYCSPDFPRNDFARDFFGQTTDRDVTVAIGPEGDFSPEEAIALREAGFEAVSFGEERLRTESAALYGVTAVHIVNDLKHKL